MGDNLDFMAIFGGESSLDLGSGGEDFDALFAEKEPATQPLEEKAPETAQPKEAPAEAPDPEEKSVTVVVSGIMLKKFKDFAGEPAPFVMELPAYHAPSASNVLRFVWERGWSFIKRAGAVLGTVLPAADVIAAQNNQ